ncbi:unnamed protein product [Aphanomyces euteiches]|uniref:Uncharacterized protein n=1 Tax=Aphanomyces euteiches TaxID=100861 RepID=A0A6G0W4Y3_9STRA|nr:hypothetical protein Ae201684_018710 [Aphanomyces euteiches]KAH9088630.1 hypothetical protein Ae201684P_017239 [Aphanomyces euteiches]KAH9157906.1 hypothetical protein AeRB84_000288 [Aphanomyces euteiches]
MLPRIQRAVRQPLLARAHGTVVSYYDSQSGQHVTYTDSVRVHGIVDEATTAPSALEVRGLDSLEVSKESWLSPSIRQVLGEDKPIYIKSNDATPRGALAVDLSCESPRETWNDHLAQCAAATKLGFAVKAVLKNAFATNDVTIQLAGSLLADAGAHLIILDDTDNLTDEDNLLEAYEALTWCDVVGLPMKQRVGLRLSQDLSSPQELLQYALTDIHIRHFDVSVHGKQGLQPAALIDALNDAGISHPLRIE